MRMRVGHFAAHAGGWLYFLSASLFLPFLAEAQPAPAPPTNGPGPTAPARLQNPTFAPHFTGNVLEIYAQLSGKTLLLWAGIPDFSRSIVPRLPSEKDKAIALIESELATNGFIMVPDGPHFVRIIPKYEEKSLAKVPLRGADLPVQKDERKSPFESPGTIPNGVINYTGADVNQVLVIYAQMTKRTILRSARLLAPNITLKTACPLSLEEAAYAMATVLELNGVALIDDGERFVQAVQATERGRVKVGVPKRQSSAELLDPNRSPTLGSSNDLLPKTKAEREIERLRKALYDFIHIPDPRASPAGRLLQFYGSLTDKTTAPPKKLGSLPIDFHVAAPLTKEELLYAIQTTFRLNDLAIITLDDGTISLARISERDSRVK